MKHCHDILLADANEAFAVSCRNPSRCAKTIGSCGQKRDGIFCALFEKDSRRF